MKKQITISAIVVAKNEEEKLPDCLESLRWCLETIVVDNASIDRTAEIAKWFSARVVKAPEEYTLNYSKLRNMGLEKSRGEWILYVDADERVTPELRDEIKEIINKQWFDKLTIPSKVEGLSIINYSAYAIPRRNIILGKEMRHGGWWPDYVKRLYLKEKFKSWGGELHEEPRFEGGLGHLENPLIHIKHDNLSEMVEKTNKWSEIEARLMFESNHPHMNFVRFASVALREFWLRMVKHMAFLDGNEGVIYALYQVYSRLISYAKLWEIQLKRNANIRSRANDMNG